MMERYVSGRRGRQRESGYNCYQTDKYEKLNFWQDFFFTKQKLSNCLLNVKNSLMSVLFQFTSVQDVVQFDVRIPLYALWHICNNFQLWLQYLKIIN